MSPLLEPGSVRVASPRAVLQVAAALGVSSEFLTRESGINPELLRVEGETIPLAQYLSLYRLAEQRTNNPDLGLMVGHISYFQGMNLHLYMTTVCRNLKEYLNVIPSTVRLQGDLGEVLIRSAGDTIRLEWHPSAKDTHNWRCLNDEMLHSSASIVGSICSLPVPVLAAELSYPQPRDTSGLKAAFGSQLRFDCEISCVYFSRECLHYPLIDVGFDLGSDFRAGPEALFEEPMEGDPFLRDTQAAMRRALPGGALTIDTLSHSLGISKRTLQRRLEVFDTNFKVLLQQLREELSLRYLRDQRLAITEIALLLGYSDQASFSNAFRLWRDCSPSEYRNKQRD